MSLLTTQQTAGYLRRIGVARPERPDVSSLAGLQLAHLLRVPFENLDIWRGVPVSLDPGVIFNKLVLRERGGYCYELNWGFATLLTSLGYRVKLVSARVAKEAGGFKQEFGHMALLVRACDMREDMLVDVGFGDGATVPIPLVSGNRLPDRVWTVRVMDEGAEWTYQEDRGGGWRARYAFTTQSRVLADFAETNLWQQSSPQSRFTQQRLCTRLTPTGRLTVAGDRLITTEGGSRSEFVLSVAEMGRMLAERFGINMDAQPSVSESHSGAASPGEPSGIVE